MSKKRVVIASSNPETILGFIPPDLRVGAEFICKKAFSTLVDLLAHEACSLLILSPGMEKKISPGKVAEVISLAPKTPVVLVAPGSGRKGVISAWKNFSLAEIVHEDDLEREIPVIIEKYIYSGHGMLRHWNLDELFDYCFPIVTTLDYDPLCQTIVDFLKEILMAESGLLVSRQDGRGSGFKILAATGIEDIKGVGTFLGEWGNRCLERCEEEGSIVAIEDLVEGASLPSFLGGLKSAFTVRLDIEGMHSVYSLMFMKARPYREILEGELIQFMLKQARFALFNAEKGIKVQSLIYIDDLTKLYNSRYLKVVLDRELKRSDRYDMPVSLLFLDIDYFKRVNDSFGHLVGSRVLWEFGSILKGCVRETDTVIRYGGDEFVAILVETSPSQAEYAAERMRVSVEEHVFMKEEELNLKLTVSIGIATYPTHAKDREQLLNMADKAMYRGKDTTRNVVYIADS